MLLDMNLPIRVMDRRLVRPVFFFFFRNTFSFLQGQRPVCRFEPHSQLLLEWKSEHSHVG